MAEFKLTPDLIPENLADRNIPIEHISGAMYALQNGETRDGRSLGDEEKKKLNKLEAEWNQGSDEKFESVAKRLYPVGTLEIGTAGLLNRSEAAQTWYKSVGERKYNPRTEPTMLNVEGLAEVGTELVDMGLAAPEVAATVVTGLADLAKSGVDFLVDFGETADSGRTIQQRFFDAKKAAADAPNIMYQPKTLSGQGLQQILFAPFVELGKFAAKTGEKSGDRVEKAFPSDNARPNRVEMHRMKELHDASLAAQQEGKQLPPTLMQEYEGYKEKFRGAITSKGEYIDVNYPALFAQYGTQELINLIPDLATSFTTAFRQVRAQNRLKEQLTQIGINRFDLTNNELLSSFDRSVSKLTDGQQYKAENFGFVQQALIDAQADRKRQTKRLYQAAEKAGDSSIATNFVAELNSSLFDLFDPSSTTFDLPNMPILQGRLNEFSKLVKGTAAKTEVKPSTRLGRSVNVQRFTPAKPPAPELTIRQLSNYRQSLNYSIKNSANPSEMAALSIVKSKFDNALNSWFERDLFSGDKKALSKWKKADEYRRQYAIDFDEKKIIQRIVENDLTQTEVKRMLVGLSEFGMAPQSARLLKEVRNADPKGYPEILRILQNDTKFDILRPLLEDPDQIGARNVQGFLKRYDSMFGTKANKELLDELFPEGFEDITTLKNFVVAAQSATGYRPSAISSLRGEMVDTTNQLSPFFSSDKIARAMSVVLFGNQLSRSALKVSTAQNLIRRVRGNGGSANMQKRVIEELTGQPYKTIIPFANLKSMPNFRIGVEISEAASNGGIDFSIGSGLSEDQLASSTARYNQLITIPKVKSAFFKGGLFGIPDPNRYEKDIEALEATQMRVKEKEFNDRVKEIEESLISKNGNKIGLKNRAVQLASEELMGNAQ